MKIHPAVTQISSIFFSVERVEMYLIKSERNALIDTGIHQSPQNDIAPALKGLGLTLADIDLILNTHGHPDHTGGNATTKSVSNAQILIHTHDVILLQGHERSFELYFAPVLEAILRHVS
jgi:glyoxylase-like metal-dependent hydrolase (beta-lactamase superfamily II)